MESIQEHGQLKEEAESTPNASAKENDGTVKVRMGDSHIMAVNWRYILCNEVV